MVNIPPLIFSWGSEAFTKRVPVVSAVPAAHPIPFAVQTILLENVTTDPLVFAKVPPFVVMFPVPRALLPLIFSLAPLFTSRIPEKVLAALRVRVPLVTVIPPVPVMGAPEKAPPWVAVLPLPLAKLSVPLLIMELLVESEPALPIVKVPALIVVVPV
jgi:hypothetical protein